MKVSVLIPTYNAENHIKELLLRIFRQELPKNFELEVIVVDSSSKDRTTELIQSHYPDVMLKSISNKVFDHGGTRNLLASLATGDYFLFMTQDAFPANDYLIKSLLRNFYDEEVRIVYARQIPKKDAKPLEVFARNFNYPDKRIVKDKTTISTLGIKTFFNSNVCSMYDSRLFKGEYKGFPENIILNEDMILSYKTIMNNKKVIYDNNAIVFHSHNYNLIQQFKRYFDIGMAFEETRFILENVSNEKEGIKMVIEQQKYLLKNRQAKYMFYGIAESGVKYIGYNMGKRHKKIPIKVKRKLSAYMK
jgi:rhamnosyltransferase